MTAAPTCLTNLLLASAGLALLAACSSGDLTPSEAGSNAADLHVVQRGPLRISVREDAELKASKENRIKSDVEGQATIIYLVPEGTVVEAGQRVVELDVSEVEEREANQAISVAKASTALETAKQNMLILEKELEAELAAAQSQLEIAQIDLEKFLGKPKTGATAGVVDGDTIDDQQLLEEVLQATAESDPTPETDAAPTVAGAPGEDGAGEEPPGGGTPESATDESATLTSPTAYIGTNRDVLAALDDLVSEIATERPQYGTLPAKLLLLLGTNEAERTERLDRDMGELGQQVLEQIVEIRNARSQLKLDEDTYQHSIKLQEKDFITRNELDRDRLRFESQSSTVQLAWQQLDILIGYALRKEQIDLELKLNNAVIGLEKVKASNDARRAREAAELDSSQREHELAKERLENFERQIENAVIYAPAPGLVVYAETDNRGRGEMIQEGSTVRERQTIIILPDVTHMTAELKVQEVDVDKVRIGQPASIQVDAFPNMILTGRVSRVSPVADSGSRWSNNNLKVYKTWVDVDYENETGELRPNMSAAVEILVGEVPDTITVPVSAVRRQRAVNYVWKATPSGPQANVVKIGRSTLTHVEILEGVREGEQVFLAEPPGMVAPQFEQPQSIQDVRELEPGGPPAGPPIGGVSAEVSAGVVDGEVTRESFQAAVLQKHPEFKELLESGGMRAFRDEGLRQAIESDPELAAMQATLRDQMRARMGEFGGRRGGENGGPGGQRGQRPRRGGGEGGGENGGGGGGRRGN